MSWKPLNLRDSQYRHRLEALKGKIIEARDKMIEIETAKLKHLADTMKLVNEHNAKGAQNALDT